MGAQAAAIKNFGSMLVDMEQIFSITQLANILAKFIDSVQYRSALFCFVLFCFVMLCYVMLCYVMLCYVILCYIYIFIYLINLFYSDDLKLLNTEKLFFVYNLISGTFYRNEGILILH